MKNIKYLLVALAFITACSQNSSDSKTEDVPKVSNELTPDVSINALVSSGGLSISSPGPADIVSNVVELGSVSSFAESIEKKIVIKNDTTSNVSLSFSMSSENFKISVSRCPQVLSPSVSCHIFVKFLPRGLYDGVYEDVLQINSDPNLAFNLRGRVENNPAPTEGTVNLSVEYLPFNDLPFSDRPVKKDLILKNNSSDKIAPAGSLMPHLSGNGSEYWSVFRYYSAKSS